MGMSQQDRDDVVMLLRGAVDLIITGRDFTAPRVTAQRMVGLSEKVFGIARKVVDAVSPRGATWNQLQSNRIERFLEAARRVEDRSWP